MVFLQTSAVRLNDGLGRAVAIPAARTCLGATMVLAFALVLLKFSGLS